MSRKFQFTALYSLLLASTGILALIASTTLPVSSSSIWGIWLVGQVLNYLALGIGLALPVAIIALTLTWFQMLLLVQGLIEPHLENQGFTETILAIFKKVISKF